MGIRYDATILIQRNFTNFRSGFYCYQPQKMRSLILNPVFCPIYNRQCVLRIESNKNSIESVHLFDRSKE